MFGSKRKALEERVSRLEFIVANPPKYKVGDKYGSKDKGAVVIAVSLDYDRYWYGYLYHGDKSRLKWSYEVWFPKSKQKLKLSE